MIIVFSSSSTSRERASDVIQKTGLRLPDDFSVPAFGDWKPWTTPTEDMEVSNVLDEALLYDDDVMSDDADLSVLSNYTQSPGDNYEITNGMREPQLKDQVYAKLTYLDNGYVVLPDEMPSPSPQHPIFDLIKRSEKQWTDKLKSQSKTLGEATAEYRRRYKRHPPKGFDEWWRFAVENKIILKDDYDQIDRDLQVFRAL